MKVCRCCGIEKPISDFSIDKRWKNTFKLDCKLCYNEKKRLKYNPEERRKEGLLRTYGISSEEVSYMYSKQDGRCAICKNPVSLISGKTKKGKAHVDHCHSTGKVRGLLCTKCNTVLGMSNDDVNVLKEAINYLERGQDD